MELAAYTHDAWAYEQVIQGSTDRSPFTGVEFCRVQQQIRLLNWTFTTIKRQAHLLSALLSAIALTSLSGWGGDFTPAIAAYVPEPSVNIAPWCNNLYLCDTNYMLEVQTLLAQRGFAVGEIDGVYGRYTKQAVIEFQKTESSLLVDGIPGRQTITLLRNIAVRQPLSNQTSPNQPSPNQKTNQNVGSDSAKQTNIRQPNNQQVMVVRRSPDPQVANSPQQKVDEIGNLQILLKQRGFYQGEIDGRQGQATTDALLKAQRTYGLPLDGLASPMTIRALIAANNLANGIQTNYQSRDFAQTPSSLQNAPLLPSTTPNVIDTK